MCGFKFRRQHPIGPYIEDHACLYGWDARATLLDTQTYINNNKGRMRYVTLCAAGLPVGSGATKGSCKSLVGTRMKRSGQRWHHEGAGSVGELRYSSEQSVTTVLEALTPALFGLR